MMTCVRRKPIITYQSPSANDSAFLPRAYGRTNALSRSLPEPLTVQKSTVRGSAQHMAGCNNHSTTTESLPLFHPLGRLATNLPPFDPRPYGLPLLPERWNASRKPGRVGNQQKVNGKPFIELASTTSTVEIDRCETKAKAIPRKSRKRKRMDAEHDTTYPAKKTRVPRETNNHVANEDLSIDQIPLINEIEAVANHPSVEVEQRQSPAQTSVKGDSEQPVSNTSPEFTAAGIQNLTGTVATLDDGKKEEGELSDTDQR
ncbi:hypothetical protein D9619_001400 [Psilocybe cf. subviscida]|uniref:Uncharacterized protein n=1 Tax=Psilocybe cf. subviscida TaxID=2480587 RepID=A0A8H5F2I9_9AGAR|nr:hypothetical protein D9619_001400 [Psilocybe cf. subviscida]